MCWCPAVLARRAVKEPTIIQAAVALHSARGSPSCTAALCSCSCGAVTSGRLFTRTTTTAPSSNRADEHHGTTAPSSQQPSSNRPPLFGWRFDPNPPILNFYNYCDRKHQAWTPFAFEIKCLQILVHLHDWPCSVAQVQVPTPLSLKLETISAGRVVLIGKCRLQLGLFLQQILFFILICRCWFVNTFV